jgi:hypothetical protein
MAMRASTKTVRTTVLISCRSTGAFIYTLRNERGFLVAAGYPELERTLCRVDGKGAAMGSLDSGDHSLFPDLVAARLGETSR